MVFCMVAIAHAKVKAHGGWSVVVSFASGIGDWRGALEVLVEGCLDPDYGGSALDAL